MQLNKVNINFSKILTDKKIQQFAAKLNQVKKKVLLRITNQAT